MVLVHYTTPHRTTKHISATTTTTTTTIGVPKQKASSKILADDLDTKGVPIMWDPTSRYDTYEVEGSKLCLRSKLAISLFFFFFFF
ncbi:hypothetical protein OWV82_000828 [Melia azedarach]|uniref:Uncharacterized protein n=1 Tax=Melia azedarach TaxID=155640 RepID=A0ACC1YYU9_MELAZ|nr:hypothetical protein OWV82_000828 [Melia azedarach]